MITAINELNETTIEYSKEEFSIFFGEIQTVSVVVETGLNIGDQIPDWEDYELLISGGGEPPIQALLAVATNNENRYYSLVRIPDMSAEQKTAITLVNDNNQLYIVDNTGKVVTTATYNETYQQQMIQRVENYLQSQIFYTSPEVESIETGATIPNWENYSIVPW